MNLIIVKSKFYVIFKKKGAFQPVQLELLMGIHYNIDNNNDIFH